MKAKRVGIFGISGSGKTTHALTLVSPLKCKRLIIFDPLEEFANKKGLTLARTLNGLIKIINRSPNAFRICYIPVEGHEPESLHKLSGIILTAQERWKNKEIGKPLTLMIDEIDMSYPLHGKDAHRKLFNKIITKGRHYHIELLGLSQRTALVGTTFRSQLTESVVFQQIGHNDAKAAADLHGYDINMIKSLPFYQYLTKINGVVKVGKTKK